MPLVDEDEEEDWDVVDDDEDEVVPVDAVLLLFELVVPGIVAALTAASAPTPTSAAAATPNVRRFSRRSALSRARDLRWLSMETGCRPSISRTCAVAEIWLGRADPRDNCTQSSRIRSRWEGNCKQLSANEWCPRRESNPRP